MASTTDATYSPRVYREQGGENLIVASSGDLYVQSGGDLIIESGGTLQLDSGSSCTVATDIEIASGASVSVASGGAVKMPVTTRATSQVGTAIPNYCVCGIEASSTAPVYALAAPVAGCMVILSVSAIGATTTVGGSAVISTCSTGVALSATGGQRLTLNGLDQTVILHGKTATRYYATKPTTVAFSNMTT